MDDRAVVTLRAAWAKLGARQFALPCDYGLGSTVRMAHPFVTAIKSSSADGQSSSAAFAPPATGIGEFPLQIGQIGSGSTLFTRSSSPSPPDGIFVAGLPRAGAHSHHLFLLATAPKVAFLGDVGPPAE